MLINIKGVTYACIYSTISEHLLHQPLSHTVYYLQHASLTEFYWEGIIFHLRCYHWFCSPSNRMNNKMVDHSCNICHPKRRSELWQVINNNAVNWTYWVDVATLCHTCWLWYTVGSVQWFHLYISLPFMPPQLDHEINNARIMFSLFISDLYLYKLQRSNKTKQIVVF